MMGPNGLAFGIVVAAYPEGNSIDVLMPKTGDRLANVQCSSITGSSNTGLVDLPEIGLPVDDSRWTLPIIAHAARYVRAIVWHVEGMPICMGFLLPQLTQMTFKRDNFRVNRHASDVYSTTNGQGDTEWYHPSGTFLRVGASPAHEDLTHQDVDQSWAIKQNTAAAPWVNLTVANAGAVVANIQVDPSGNINVTHNGNLTVNTKGNAAVTVEGTTTVTSTGAADLKAPTVKIDSPSTTCTGALTVQGALTFEAGMTGSGGEGAVVQINGSIESTGDQVAGGISQIGHEHTSESPGSPTSPPIAGT
jgi:phage baseplate assembly protein gpV